MYKYKKATIYTSNELNEIQINRIIEYIDLYEEDSIAESKSGKESYKIITIDCSEIIYEDEEDESIGENSIIECVDNPSNIGRIDDNVDYEMEEIINSEKEIKVEKRTVNNQEIQVDDGMDEDDADDKKADNEKEADVDDDDEIEEDDEADDDEIEEADEADDDEIEEADEADDDEIEDADDDADDPDYDPEDEYDYPDIEIVINKNVNKKIVVYLTNYDYNSKTLFEEKDAVSKFCFVFTVIYFTFLSVSGFLLYKNLEL